MGCSRRQRLPNMRSSTVSPSPIPDSALRVFVLTLFKSMWARSSRVRRQTEESEYSAFRPRLASFCWLTDLLGLYMYVRFISGGTMLELWYRIPVPRLTLPEGAHAS